MAENNAPVETQTDNGIYVLKREGISSSAIPTEGVSSLVSGTSVVGRRRLLILDVSDDLVGFGDEVVKVDFVPMEDRREVFRPAGDIDGLAELLVGYVT